MNRALMLTIPKNAPNKKLAVKFINFLLSKNSGLKILACNGQNPMIPSYSTTYSKIPTSLKKYALQQKRRS